MFKKRNISVYNDFKTSFFYKIFLIIGFILLIFYGIQHVVPLVDVSEHILGIVLAFSILFLGIGFLIYFLSRQFAKLARIADEIENEEEIEDID